MVEVFVHMLALFMTCLLVTFYAHALILIVHAHCETMVTARIALILSVHACSRV